MVLRIATERTPRGRVVWNEGGRANGMRCAIRNEVYQTYADQDIMDEGIIQHAAISVCGTDLTIRELKSD